MSNDVKIIKHLLKSVLILSLLRYMKVDVFSLCKMIYYALLINSIYSAIVNIVQ